jgi:NAD(P)-dependent dehydrogenase (short-subunit alcohol dehydrogenase family)
MNGFRHPVEKRAMDVTSDDDVKLVVECILEEQGKINIVVNNAGAIAIGSLEISSYSEPINMFVFSQDCCQMYL